MVSADKKILNLPTPSAFLLRKSTMGENGMNFTGSPVHLDGDGLRNTTYDLRADSYAMAMTIINESRRGSVVEESPVGG